MDGIRVGIASIQATIYIALCFVLFCFVRVREGEGAKKGLLPVGCGVVGDGVVGCGVVGEDVVGCGVGSGVGSEVG